MTQIPRPSTPPIFLFILAAGLLIWAVIGVVYVAFSAPAQMPHLVHNYHAEHLAVFYVLTLLAITALPIVRASRIMMAMAAVAVIYEAIRYLNPARQAAQDSVPENLLCDLAGVVSVAGPLVASQLRMMFKGAGSTPTA